MQRVVTAVLLLLLATASAIAQTDIESTFAHAFAQLDLGETETGVLAERGTYVISPLAYDGSPTAPALTGGMWRTLYVQFTHSYAGTPTIPAASTIDAATTAVASQGQIPIAVLWQPMDRFRDDSSGPKRLDLDEDEAQFFRPLISGAARGSKLYAAPTPYIRSQFFGAGAVGAGLSGIAQVRGYTTFVLTPALVVSADGSAISNIQIDFGDGSGYRSVAPGQTVRVGYSAVGRVEARLRATVAGATRYASFALDVLQTAAASRPAGLIPDLSSGDKNNEFDYKHGRRPFTGSGSPDSHYNGTFAAEYRWAAYLRAGADPNSPTPIQNPIGTRHAPRASIISRSTGRLWIEWLSHTTMSPRSRLGARCSRTNISNTSPST